MSRRRCPGARPGGEPAQSLAQPQATVGIAAGLEIQCRDGQGRAGGGEQVVEGFHQKGEVA